MYPPKVPARVTLPTLAISAGSLGFEPWQHLREGDQLLQLLCFLKPECAGAV